MHHTSVCKSLGEVMGGRRHVAYLKPQGRGRTGPSAWGHLCIHRHTCLLNQFVSSGFSVTFSGHHLNATGHPPGPGGPNLMHTGPFRMHHHMQLRA